MRIVAAGLLIPVLSSCATVPVGQLTSFEQVLAAHDSATLALTEWCQRQGIAAAPVITATQIGDERPAEPAGLREALAATASEPLGFRHVRLACGNIVLSEADNWYVPARLTPAMNAALASTQIPFGRVAAPLGFHRERLASERGSIPGCPSGTILRQRGLLRLPDGTPLSLVSECYLAANLGG